MTSSNQPTLDCQDCGNEVMKLSPAQAQEVALNPYNFVVYCPPCKRVRAAEGAQRRDW
jgi:uncharacterized protein with PIN domain